MAPLPQDPNLREKLDSVNSGLDDNAIVISGISGLYPECSNVQGLSELLYNKVLYTYILYIIII